MKKKKMKRGRGEMTTLYHALIGSSEFTDLNGCECCVMSSANGCGVGAMAASLLAFLLVLLPAISSSVASKSLSPWNGAVDGETEKG